MKLKSWLILRLLPYSDVVVERLIELGEMTILDQHLMTGVSLQQLPAVIKIPQYLLTVIKSVEHAILLLMDGRQIKGEENYKYCSFALILSTNILVDDAIVWVENIHHHRQIGSKSLRGIILAVVDEVSNPTILATFAAITDGFCNRFNEAIYEPDTNIGMLWLSLVAYILTPIPLTIMVKFHFTSGIYQTSCRFRNEIRRSGDSSGSCSGEAYRIDSCSGNVGRTFYP